MYKEGGQSTHEHGENTPFAIQIRKKERDIGHDKVDEGNIWQDTFHFKFILSQILINPSFLFRINNALVKR